VGKDEINPTRIARRALVFFSEVESILVELFEEITASSLVQIDLEAAR